MHVIVLERLVKPVGRGRRHYRYRAVCQDCPWRTPWRTTGRVWPDAPERSWLTPRSITVRAAGEHLRGRA
jgi:hypothetical protein